MTSIGITMRRASECNRAGWRTWLVRRSLQSVLICAVGWTTGLVAAEARIQIQDDRPYHVHDPDTPFSISVRVTDAGLGDVAYHWEGYRGRSLSAPEPIRSGAWQTIRSPARAPGYYGLVFQASTPDLVLPGRRVGEPREYGFVVLPPPAFEKHEVDLADPFGVVHVDANDPYLGGWSKTTTWEIGRVGSGLNLLNVAEWRSHIDYTRDLGLSELPIISGAPWVSNDASAVSSRQLSRIQSLSRQYFQADTRARYWEVGIEENLSAAYEKAFYWSNLAAKTRAVREAADAINPDIKLIYQVAGIDTASVERFLNSEAAQSFDIISLHPYAWPDFPDPDTWVEDYVNSVRQSARASGHGAMPIWFTEVGAPHQGNYPGGFFGYPSSGNQVGGLSRRGEVSFLIKMHVLALQAGVEKLFWYNYQDWGDRREYAEDHFGLRDYLGFPKPAYAAYVTLRRQLDGKTPGDVIRLPDDVSVSKFKGVAEDLFVIWRHASGLGELINVPWTAFEDGLSETRIGSIVNAVGAPIRVAANGLSVGAEPVFVTVKHQNVSSQ